MTRMTGPDCVVMCNLINTHTHTQVRYVWWLVVIGDKLCTVYSTVQLWIIIVIITSVDRLLAREEALSRLFDVK